MFCKIHPEFILSVTILILASCDSRNELESIAELPKVHIEQIGDNYTLIKDNEPYLIKGASGPSNLKLLSQAGGNSLSVYESRVTNDFLDSAQSFGISISVILEVSKPMHQADYSDKSFKEEQRNRILNFVRKYKDHPAILFWTVGNEAHLGGKFNYRLWQEVNVLSKNIHEIDKDHPTTTAIAGFGLQSLETVQVKLFAPDIDFISFNVFDFYHRVKRESRNFIWGWDGPYVITEFSSNPYWNLPKTDWDAIIEPDGSTRAKELRHRYFTIIRDTSRCLGTYAFYWGQKQERTHTSFSLILDNKLKTQSYQELSFCWKGVTSENHCPRIEDYDIANYEKYSSIYLKPESLQTVRIAYNDPNNDFSHLKWEILEEGRYNNLTGGDKEKAPDCISDGTIADFDGSFEFRTPIETGPYRIFIYCIDDNDNVGTANIPFYILQ